MFGFRARDEARQLQFGDVVLKLTSDGQKYLEFHERSTKTRDGSNLHNCRETTPKIFSLTTNSERDPIALYETFKEKRPSSALEPGSPFFLTPIPVNRLKGTSGEPWYYPRPMGESTLGGLLRNAAEEAGIAKRITNHSIRKTTVTSLSRAGVPPQKIMKITGHKNIQSITHYDAQLSDQEHRHICGILQGNPVQSIATYQSSFIPQTASNTFPVHQIQNTTVQPQSVHCPPQSVHFPPQSVHCPPSSNKEDAFPPFMSGSSFYNCTFQFTGKF